MVRHHAGKPGGSASVLITLCDAELTALLEERLSADFEVRSSAAAQADLDTAPARGKSPGDWSGFDAVLAGTAGDPSGFGTAIESARRAGFGGLVVAVLEPDEYSHAAALTRAGADHIVYLPASELDLDVLAEKIRAGRLSRAAGPDVMLELLGPVQQGLVLLDADREMVFANAAARENLSAATDEDVARTVSRSCTDNIFEKSRVSGSAVTYADVPVDGEGTHRMLGMEVCHFGGHSGGGLYLVLIHDFSRWKKLDELRSKFATSLSHRMRTPLTSIRNAVRLLGQCVHDSSVEEKDRLIEIGCRNVEKMIANLDDLQKLFMIESEELNVCRTMTGLRGELESIFEESSEEEKIRGYKLSAADVMVFAGKGRLRDFFVSAVDAYDVWLSEKPFIECSTSIREESSINGEKRRRLVIYLRPRATVDRKICRDSLREFLSLNEAHRGLVLGRLAAALDAELKISTGNTISLSLPLDPEFSREKDLVHPLHMMTERADLTGSEFSLVSLRIKGAADAAAIDVMQKVLSVYVGSDLVVSMSEQRGQWSVFMNDRSAEEIEAAMTEIRREFLRRCHDCGLDVYPSVDWETRYIRKAGTNGSPLECLLAADGS